MKIFLATDHRGFHLKEDVKEWLATMGHEIVDMGNHEYDQNDDFPDFVGPAATQVVADQARGIIFCGSGAGAEIAANKIKGARAGLGLVKEQVMAARADDDLNILVIAADFVGKDRAQEMIEAFLQTEFKNEERFVRRLAKIKALESSL